MPRARVAGLAGGVDAQAGIPVADIHHHAERRPGGDAEIRQAVASIHRGGAGAAFGHRAHAVQGRGHARQRMFEEAVMQPAPLPRGHIIPQPGAAIRHCAAQRGQ